MDNEAVIRILEKAGASSEESRNAIVAFHGGVGNLIAAGEMWYANHLKYYEKGQIVVPYATAVELGYRIAKQEGERNE